MFIGQNKFQVNEKIGDKLTRLEWLIRERKELVPYRKLWGL